MLNCGIRGVRMLEPMECPLCHARGACPECDGLGEVTCSECDGLGCEACQRSGAQPCLPCAGSGACPRCKGSGEVETLVPPPFRYGL